MLQVEQHKQISIYKQKKKEQKEEKIGKHMKMISKAAFSSKPTSSS